MSTAVMTMQQHRPMPAKKMVMMLSPPHDVHQPQIVQPSNGACVIVSNGYPSSPPQFTNLDAPANNNNAKAKNNNCSALNKVSRVGGGVVQKTLPRTSVVVAATPANAAAVDALRCKRRIQFSQPGAAPGAAPGAFTGHQTASVARRNARERNRVKQVNNGFATLRSHIPPAIAAALQEAMGTTERPPSARASAKEKEAAKKLSKVETLRMAVEYIRSLQALLQESGGSNENAAPTTVKTETSDVMSDSPHGFDSDYEAALALSHYSMAAESSSPPTSGVATHVVTSTTSVYPHHNHHHHPHFVSMSPPCSAAGSAGSPSPSYVSDGSVGPSSTGYAAPTTFVPTVCRPTTLTVHSPATPPDSNVYEPMSPEDEELLDVISWWQQSN